MGDLQTWMKANGVTDAALAAQVGVSRVQVTRIRGKKSRPSPETAKRIEAVTAIPAADLIFGASA